MKELADLFSEVEGSDFSARVNVASDFETFRRALTLDPTFRDVTLLIKDDCAPLQITARVFCLCAQTVDLRYENPSDAAIAAYVLILSKHEPYLARLAAAVAQATQNGFWANRVAEFVLSERDFSVESDLAREILLPIDFSIASDSSDWYSLLPGDIRQAVEAGTLANSIDQDNDSANSDFVAYGNSMDWRFENLAA